MTSNINKPWWDQSWMPSSWPVADGFVLCSPGLARHMLNSSIGNRPLRQGDVERYKEAITNGTWEPLVDTIVFDEQCRLQEGHHRLTAIAEGERVVPIMVRQAPRERVAPLIDTGRRRTVGDTLSSGFVDGRAWKNGSQLSAIASAWLRYNANDIYGNRVQVDYSQVVELVTQYPAIAEVAENKNLYTNKHMRGGPYLFVLAAALTVDRIKGMAFMEGVRDGVGLCHGDPRLTLRDAWDRTKRKGSLAYAMQLNYAVRAWNSFYDNEPLVLLKWSPSNKSGYTMKGLDQSTSWSSSGLRRVA